MKNKLKKLSRKKWVRIVAVLVVAAIVIVPTANKYIGLYQRFSVKNPIPLSDVFVKQTDRNKIELTSHRAFSCQAPENTAAAVAKAGEYGVQSVEIDVRQTQDGVWVVSHDAKINNITNGKGKISSLTYYDLVAYKINRGANYKEYANITISTLEQVLECCLENNIKPMIEIKDYTPEGIDTLLQIITKNGFTENCWIISFDRTALELVKERNSNIELVVLVDKLSKKEIQKCLETPEISVSFNGGNSLNTESRIKKLQDAGINLIAWTIDSPEKMQELYKLGITHFVTNRIYK